MRTIWVKALINLLLELNKMKKQHLLQYLDDTLLEKLFGFCYARTEDSHCAQELCSDIILALVEAAHTDGTLNEPYAFIWRVARNVYADCCARRARRSALFDDGDPEEAFARLADEAADEDSGDAERLAEILRRVAFLTRAYREVMVLYYLDGLSVAEIAARQRIGESAVRQRLFAARKKIRNEVEYRMDKPISLDRLEIVLIGTGDPSWGDPCEDFRRQLSKQVVWLCRRKPMRASEVAQALNVPTVYIEEELELLTAGANGQHGLLRRLDDGRYAINIVLFDRDEAERAFAIYTERLPLVSDTIAAFVEENKAAYLAYPYLNRKVDLNLILWQQVFNMAQAFSVQVERILAERYFADVQEPARPYSVYGYRFFGKEYGCGWDGTSAENLCGYARVRADNIYISRIRKHFSCGANLAKDIRLQLALRAVNGLPLAALSEKEREQAARAVDCGYLCREGDTLYTKVLVGPMRGDLFAITNRLQAGCFDAQAEDAAASLAAFFRKTLPPHLLGEWRLANCIAGLPMYDALAEALIDRGLLVPPADGVGAEGCWLTVEPAPAQQAR